MSSLIQKYNVPGPRYTSYPTVPFWEEDAFSEKKWTQKLTETFKISKQKEGIS
jgi:oxygen-independent coproporphyrinogen-3 oxidase